MSIMRSAGIKSTLASFVEVAAFFCILSVIYFVLSYVVYSAIAMPRHRAQVAEALASAQENTLEAERELNEAIENEADDLATVESLQQAFDEAQAALYGAPALADLVAARDAAQAAIIADDPVLSALTEALEDAQAALDADPDNADLVAALEEAQLALDEAPRDAMLVAARNEAQIALDDAPKDPELLAAFEAASTALDQAQSQARSATRWRDNQLAQAKSAATACGLLMVTEAVENANALLQQGNQATAATEQINTRIDRFIAIAAPDPIATVDEASEISDETPAEDADEASLAETDAPDEASAAEEAPEAEPTEEELAELATQAAQAAREARLAKVELIRQALGDNYADLLTASTELDAARFDFQTQAEACYTALYDMVTANENAANNALAAAERAEDEDAPIVATEPLDPWAQALIDEFLVDRNEAQTILRDALPGITASAEATRDHAQEVLTLAQAALADLETSTWATTLIDPADEALAAELLTQGEAFKASIEEAREAIMPMIQSALEETRELMRQQQAVDPDTGLPIEDAPDMDDIQSAWLRGEEVVAVAEAFAPCQTAIANAATFMPELQAYVTVETNHPVALQSLLASSVETLATRLDELQASPIWEELNNPESPVDPVALEESLTHLTELADQMILSATAAQEGLAAQKEALIDEAISMTNLIQDDAKSIIRYCDDALESSDVAALPVVDPGQGYGRSFSQGLQEMRLGRLFSAKAPFFHIGRIFAAMPWWLWIVVGGLYIVFLMIYWAPSDDPVANTCEVRAFVLFGLVVLALMLIRAEIASQRISHSIKLFFQLLS
jgi:hypothetical protein